jgi:AraC-like DNA-binding protein
MTDYWTTDNLGNADQISYWTDVLCQAFTPLAPWRSRDHVERSHIERGLPGWVRSASIGDSNAAEIASCTQRISHGDREVSRTTDDVVFVNLQIAGQCVTSQDGRECMVSRGEFTVVDSTRPYRLEFAEPNGEEQLWRVLSFRLPRAPLADLLDDPAASATARTFTESRGSARIVRSMMLEAWRSDESMDPSERQIVGATHSELVRAVLTGARSVADRSAGLTDDVRRLAAVRYIDRHLQSGHVSATETAHHVGVSVRTLHAIFERHNTTFGAVVRRHRLEACRQDLANVADDRPIATLAATWGYADSAHLAKAFRAQFGCSPGEYRRAQRLRESLRQSP